jgi:hypothetical protein
MHKINANQDERILKRLKYYLQGYRCYARLYSDVHGVLHARVPARTTPVPVSSVFALGGGGGCGHPGRSHIKKAIHSIVTI